MRKRVVLVGGGSAGFFTASAIASNPHLDYDVVVVHSPEIGVIGVGESTTAYVPRALDELGIVWTDFFQKVEPVFKLGIRFTFAPHDAPWNHFYYPFQASYGPVEEVMRGMIRYEPGYYMLREQNKVCHNFGTYLMDRGRGPLAIDGKFKIFGFHFRNDRYINYLQHFCIAHGAQVMEGTVSSVLKDEKGYISAIVLNNGNIVRGDLFIDNTGFSSLLLEGEMGEKWIPSQLLCDRAVIGSWMRSPELIKPYTLCEAMSAGWMWQIDHTTETNRGYVYSSSFISDAEAEQEFHTRTNHCTETTRIIKFRSGHRERAWVKNVIGLGNSYAFVEPLESTGLHILCCSANELVKCLVQHGHDWDNEALRAYYNTLVKEIWTETFDFIALHYKLCRTYDTPFWQACRANLQLGTSSQVMLDHYTKLGPSVVALPTLSRQNMFGPEGYYALLMGLGVPTSCKNPVDDAELDRWRRIQLQRQNIAAQHISAAEAVYLSKISQTVSF